MDNKLWPVALTTLFCALLVGCGGSSGDSSYTESYLAALDLSGAEFDTGAD